ncbi:hypothetical protein WJX73_004483 [Symbiochloris irregularis]|uniref:Nucleolar protein 16 n=1 Tax=Symbiochloris irregularis TaxID=706552 RepID=A0AAW1PZA1_9CHLO
MGGSLRRLKKTRPKVSIKSKRKPKVKSSLPHELKKASPAVLSKLGLTNWDNQKTYAANYAEAQLVPNANAAFGRNSRTDALQAKAAQLSTSEDLPETDEVREILHKERPEYKPNALKLTTQQSIVVKQLLDKHGDDIEGMVWDSKLNSMLLPAGKLRRMIRSFKEADANARCPFRAPKKRL